MNSKLLQLIVHHLQEVNRGIQQAGNCEGSASHPTGFDTLEGFALIQKAGERKPNHPLLGLNLKPDETLLGRRRSCLEVLTKEVKQCRLEISQRGFCVGLARQGVMDSREEQFGHFVVLSPSDGRRTR